MADPFSMVASITAVITFTAQVGKLLNEFTSCYRDTASDLEELGTEIRLLEVVLGELESAYRSHTTSPGSATFNGYGEEGKGPPTDTTLQALLDGLNQCMKQLEDVITKSYERVEKGGLHKIRVQSLWLRTSKGIEKIRTSLFGYKMTLMLLLEAKTLERTKSLKVTEEAVQAALMKAETYRSGIAAGEKTLAEVRRYLDDIGAIPSEPSDVQIGTSDAVRTFQGFDEWIASFSGGPSQQLEDDRLVEAFKKGNNSSKEAEQRDSPSTSGSPEVTPARQSKVMLIVTNLQRQMSKETFVEQLFVDANVEIMEVLQMLKAKGYSSVTGFQTTGPNKEGRMGPIYPVSGSVPVVVTTGKSCYDVSKGLRINQDETFVSFYNKYIMQRRPQRSEVLVTRKLDSIHVKDSITNEACSISFRRTLRVPEDMDVHNTPSTFGPFPLVDVSRCENAAVIPQVKAKSGLLIPLLQREALCVAFDAEESWLKQSWLGGAETRCLFSARLFAGSLNAVSGRPSTDRSDSLQDYIVIPLQNRVDGFNDTDGRRVKQFVSAPLGSGYSVESHLAENEIGGLQLQIAPRLKTCVKFERIGGAGGNGGEKIPLMRSPQVVGLADGDVIQMEEEEGSSLVVPWNWDTVKDASRTDLMKWALCGWDGCERSSGSERYCPRCLSGPQHQQTIRPAYLSDLLNDAGIEQQGALAVAAVTPISVTLRHFAEGRVDAPKVMLFSTTLQVSPFERPSVLRCRILSLLDLWREEHSMRRSLVGISGLDWLAYETHREKYYTNRLSIQALGINEGSVIETMESSWVPAAPPAEMPCPPRRKPTGWEMALAGGGTIRQGIKVDPGPEHWNWDAAHFINIQILNSVAFESVTGLAPPLSPISFAEYTKAGIPSMSFYPDDQACPAVIGKFRGFRTTGEMDRMLGVTYAPRLSAAGNSTGCIVCERRICDAILEQCRHAFCTTCIRFRMQGAGHITCLLCSKASTKKIIISAPMDITQPATAVHQGEQAQGLSLSPSQTPTPAGGLQSLRTLERVIDVSLQRDDKASKEIYVRSMLNPACTEVQPDTKSRLALAQLLKDIDYPRQPPASFIVAAVTAVLGESIPDCHPDLLDILLNISLCSEDPPALSGTILRRACSRETEQFAKRLVDEGYDASTLKKKFRKDEKRKWSGSEDVRQRILAYARERRVSMRKRVQEFDGTESITS